jgi:hypothetical protein
LFDHANRVHAVYFEYPSQKVDDVTIELPLGWQVASSPNPQNQAAKVIGYSLKVDHDAGALHWTRKLNVDVLYLEPKYYPSLRNFFQGVRTGDDEQVVLQPATATTAE